MCNALMFTGNIVILSSGDVKVKQFVLNDKEKALKEQFLKRYKFHAT